MSAEGYYDYSYTLNFPTGGTYMLQNITLLSDVEAFTDSHDGKTYSKVTIGSQTWMAENLNYDFPGVTSDVCYNNSADSCAKYGRLYDWSTAMGGYPSSSADPSGVQGACPSGWHLPSDAEWDVLMVAVGGVKEGDYFWHGAGTKLKSKTGWQRYIGVPAGTDEFGFSALPGSGISRGVGDFVGNYGFWWSATEYSAGGAWDRRMGYDIEYVYRYANGKTDLFSVRCVQG